MNIINKILSLFKKKKPVDVPASPAIDFDVILPGDVWEYGFAKSKDPFVRQQEPIQYLILDVKDGYVQYRHVKYPNGGIYSSKVSYMKYDAKLVSRKKHEEKT